MILASRMVCLKVLRSGFISNFLPFLGLPILQKFLDIILLEKKVDLDLQTNIIYSGLLLFRDEANNSESLGFTVLEQRVYTSRAFEPIVTFDFDQHDSRQLVPSYSNPMFKEILQKEHLNSLFAESFSREKKKNYFHFLYIKMMNR